MGPAGSARGAQGSQSRCGWPYGEACARQA